MQSSSAQVTFEAVNLQQFGATVLLCVPVYIAHTQHYIPCNKLIKMHVSNSCLVCILAAIFAIDGRV